MLISQHLPDRSNFFSPVVVFAIFVIFYFLENKLAIVPTSRLLLLMVDDIGFQKTLLLVCTMINKQQQQQRSRKNQHLIIKAPHPAVRKLHRNQIMVPKALLNRFQPFSLYFYPFLSNFNPFCASQKQSTTN